MTRLITRPSGTWELLGDDQPVARDPDPWYWVAMQRRGGWRWYSGVVRVPPKSADEEELVPQLEEVVRTCREVWK
jgi:hypothetical protein